MDSFLADIRFAARSLLRRRTFAAIAIATIGLSIGAATSIFSIVDGVLFRSLPYRDPGKLVAVWQTYPGWKKQPILARQWDRITLDYGDFIRWRKQQTVFAGIGLYGGRSILLSGNGESELASGSRVSPSLFEMLGAKPVVGRFFLPGEDVIGGPDVTVISFEAWQNRFGGRRDIVGTTIGFDRRPYTIVGVLPPRFSLERGKPGAQFWVPAGRDSSDLFQRNHSFRAIARLKPGVTQERASAETTQLLQGSDPPEKKGLHLVEYHRDETREVRGPLLVLLGAVGLLLLIACVNIATLLLGEAASREQEMGARVALGASRTRLVRQLLTESTLLSGVGALLGAGLAWWGTKALVALAPDRIPGIQNVSVDLRVLFAALGAAGITGVLFGLAPAAMLSGSRGPSALLRGGGQSAAGRGSLQRVFIAVELALSVVLLVGAALVARSLAKLTSVDPGFRTDHLLVVTAALPRAEYGDSVARRAFYAEGMARLAAIPGVAATTAINGVPFSGNSSSSSYVVEGATQVTERGTEVQHRIVVPGYFSTMGISLLAGRAFSTEDRTDAPRVAVISAAAARRDWPNESAIGKRVKYQSGWWTIVGVVGDTKYAKLSGDDEPTIYTPLAQRLGGMSFLLRTRGEPAAMSGAARTALRVMAPTIAITNTDVMDELVRRSFGEERFRTMLITLFGIMAGVLAVVGMYGVTARAVGRRTREVGIRVALGATPASVIRMVVTHTFGAVLIGVVAGVLVASATSRVLMPYLFGIDAHDPLTYAGIIGLLALVSVIASWLPARRAGRIEPATVLRGG